MDVLVFFFMAYVLRIRYDFTPQNCLSLCQVCYRCPQAVYALNSRCAGLVGWDPIQQGYLRFTVLELTPWRPTFNVVSSQVEIESKLTVTFP